MQFQSPASPDKAPFPVLEPRLSTPHTFSPLVLSQTCLFWAVPWAWHWLTHSRGTPALSPESVSVSGWWRGWRGFPPQVWGPVTAGDNRGGEGVPSCFPLIWAPPSLSYLCLFWRQHLLPVHSWSHSPAEMSPWCSVLPALSSQRYAPVRGAAGPPVTLPSSHTQFLTTVQEEAGATLVDQEKLVMTQ